MKNKNFIIDWSDVLTEVVILFMIIFIPLLIMIALGNSWLDAFFNLKFAIPPLFTILGSFLINYYWLIPSYLIKNRSSAKYWVFCIGLFILLSAGAHVLGYYIYPKVSPGGLLPVPAELLIASQLSYILYNMLLLMAAMSLRFRQHNRQLEIEHAKHDKEQAQNELLRLKGQLNPHFLFNTLNNISSLSAFDPDATQESISRLSEMLRYVLYDSSTEMVPLHKDIEFIKNYINLMQIRYDETLKLNTTFQITNPERQIPPMLFISLLENAYKYGASSLHECHLDIVLKEDGQQLLFTVTNTLLTDQEMASKKKGGVGLDNLKKRLELTYPDSHTFTYGIVGDVFKAEVQIKG